LTKRLPNSQSHRSFACRCKTCSTTAGVSLDLADLLDHYGG
jgi:hypothetical protein